MAKDMSNDLSIPTFDTSKWTEEQVSFAPYWSPKEGASFIARIVQKDEKRTDADFTRYLLQAGEDLQCSKGPANEAETVTVKKGEMFTISVYSSLQGLFDFYLEENFRPWMKVLSVDEQPVRSKPGHTVWTWKLLVSPDDKKRANQLRAGRQAKQLSPKSEDSQAELS